VLPRAPKVVRLHWTLVLLALLCLPVAGALAQESAAAPDEPVALHIASGSLARRQVVALGRDLQVDGEALSDVAAVDGSIRVTGTVRGDVIVLGGEAELSPTARIDGDVFVLGGNLTTADGARIGGQAVSYPTFSTAWLTLLEGPALSGSATSPVVLGAKLALLAAWLLLTLILLAVSRREVVQVSTQLTREPFRCFVVGLTGVLALFLTGLFFSAFAAVVVGVPLLALVAVISLVLKFFGMVAVFHATGDFLGRRLGRSSLGVLEASLIGLGVLGLLKMIPYLGVWVWTATTFVGIGATLMTKFGRLEPWFDSESAWDGGQAR
jgi:cytoskeletal protein CcmA (bactofilin family)